MKRQVISGVLVIGLLATAASADDFDLLFMGGFRGAKLTKAIKKADEHPLGSDRNPVRVNMPVGQQAYLSRLRCSDGKAPMFERGGSTGPGPFGSIVDVYSLDCGGSTPGKVSVFLDMYHPKHLENRPIPGFTIAS